MSKARVLVDKFLIQPVWIIWVKATSASIVDLNLRPPSWLGWINLFEAILNWSLSPITFLMSLHTVLRRIIGLNVLGKLYDFLFGLEMITVVDLLKCEGQHPNSIHMLAILMMILRQSSSLKIILRWLYNNLFGPRVEELLQLIMASLNSSFKKAGQGNVSLSPILSRIWHWPNSKESC